MRNEKKKNIGGDEVVHIETGERQGKSKKS